jgi:dynein heavy chain, axonemal
MPLPLSRWRKLHASWMGDSWTKLDGDSVEKEVMTVFKVMTKTSKVLASRELPACSENCTTIKEEVSTQNTATLN